MVFDPQVPLSAAADRDYVHPSDDADATRVCGQGVITKLLKKAPGVASNQSSGAGESSSSRNFAPKNLPFSRRRYEEVHRHLLASPDDTESCSTSSDKSSDERRHAHAAAANTAGSYIVQFVQGQEGNHHDASNSSRRQVVQPFNFSRNTPWSTCLPAVTEETSSVETEETPLPKDGHEPPTPSGTGIKHSSPEKNEMLAAMRNLVLKQQSALKELSNENSHYRKKMEEYQNMLIKMKRIQAEKDGLISQLQLEKEAFETESMWLRGQIEAMTREAEIDDDELQRKLRSLMAGGGLSDAMTPSSIAERAAVNAFNSFKRTLSPGTVMDRAVKSLHCKSPTWEWEMKDEEEDNEEEDNDEDDDDDRGGHESDSSESVPDDERMMTPKSKTKKRPTKQLEEDKPEARDDEPETSERDTSSSSEARSTPPKRTASSKSPSKTTPSSSPVWGSAEKNVASPATGQQNREEGNEQKQLRPPKPKPLSKSSPDSTSSSSPMWEKSQAGTPTKGQREEVDIFKQRLESLQKKRTDRQTERKQSSKPVVRFGTITI